MFSVTANKFGGDIFLCTSSVQLQWLVAVVLELAIERIDKRKTTQEKQHGFILSVEDRLQTIFKLITLSEYTHTHMKCKHFRLNSSFCDVFSCFHGRKPRIKRMKQMKIEIVLIFDFLYFATSNFYTLLCFRVFFCYKSAFFLFQWWNVRIHEKNATVQSKFNEISDEFEYFSVVCIDFHFQFHLLYVNWNSIIKDYCCHDITFDKVVCLVKCYIVFVYRIVAKLSK